MHDIHSTFRDFTPELLFLYITAVSVTFWNSGCYITDWYNLQLQRILTFDLHLLDVLETIHDVIWYNNVSCFYRKGPLLLSHKNNWHCYLRQDKIPLIHPTPRIPPLLLMLLLLLLLLLLCCSPLLVTKIPDGKMIRTKRASAKTTRLSRDLQIFNNKKMDIWIFVEDFSDFCVGHTAWAPEGREGGSQARLKDRHLSSSTSYLSHGYTLSWCVRLRDLIILAYSLTYHLISCHERIQNLVKMNQQDQREKYCDEDVLKETEIEV